MKQTFSRLLVVALLVVACSGAAWGDNLTVTVTKSGGTRNTKTGEESLRKALEGVTLSEVEGIEVRAGKFETADWYWLRNNRKDLENLKKFVVTDGIGSVSDIPNTDDFSRYFSDALKELHIAKLQRVGDYAFYYCEGLTSVSLPAGIEIGRSAFKGCEGLTSLELGATPPSVKLNAFLGCPLVRRLVLIDANGTPLTGDALTDAISRYRAVEDGDTEDNLWYVWAFEDAPASNLSGSIDGETFSGKASLQEAMQGKDLGKVKELTITGGSFLVSDWAFLRGKLQEGLAIKTFTIESGVEKVADMPELPIYTSTYLPMAQQVNIAKVKKIGDRAFDGCGGLTSVSLPAATEIGRYAFSGCKALTSVSLPAATEIGDGAFYVCKGLTSLELGATPPNVGRDAFLGCPLVRKLKLLDADGTPLTGDALTNAISRYIAVEDGDTEDNLWYGWAFEDEPASNLSGAIDGVAFSGAASLEVAMQGKNFRKVKEVTITGGRFQLSDWDFLLQEGKYSLAIEKFTIESSVDRVVSMPDLLFYSPRYLPDAQKVNIAKIRKIGKNAFYRCTGLTSVSLPAATEIGWEAFYGCTNLTSVSLPAATEIGERAFSVCTGLTSVSLPGATVIGKWAFNDCTGLTSVSLPAATEIRSLAFRDCKGLTSVSLPAATKIGEEAFKGCECFTSLQLGATPPSVESGAFAGCPGVRTLIITDAAGVPLVGEALSIAANAYDGYAGDPIDGKWKGWAIQMDSPRMGSVEIVPVDCGTVSIIRKDGGEVVSQGDVLKEGAVLVVEGKPENGYRVKAITAEGAKKIGDKEWEVTAMTGKVTFTVEFEKKPEGESNNPTPVESALLAQAQLSPNPTDGQVTIDAGTTLARCEVYSSTGALLQAIESPKRVFTIDLSASPSGVYLVRLVDVNGESKTLRAVKQ